jgi:hypothetical protein
MVEKTAKKDRFIWRPALYVNLSALVIFIPIVLWQSDGLYVIFVVPVVSIFLVIFLFAAAIAKKPRECLSILATLIIYWAISAALVMNYSTIRSSARWLIWSGDYKSKVLEQQAPLNGELKHIEWDDWGWGGENTTMYLAFDPTDSLSMAAQSHQPGKFNGIPCQVYRLRRLESHWYTVLFYTNEIWGRCN